MLIQFNPIAIKSIKVLHSLNHDYKKTIETFVEKYFRNNSKFT